MSRPSPDPRDPSNDDEELLDADTAAIVSRYTDADRVARMQAELQMGFGAMAHVGRAVSVFGSARTPEDHPEYASARELGRLLGERGWTIITGGGPGTMEAANRGAADAGAESIGLTIELPFESSGNPWVSTEVPFHYFFARKVMFVRYASAFVVFPGGFGTMDELWEALTLIQVEKIRHFPVVLVGRSFWGGLLEWVREVMAAEGKISPHDLDRFVLTDDLEEVIHLVEGTQARRPRGASS